MTHALAWMPGPFEIAVIAIVGLVIFGRRLPEVGRSLGKSIVEFKRGVREAKDEIDVGSSLDEAPPSALPPGRQSPPRTAGAPPDSQPSEQEESKSGETPFSEYR